MSLEKHVKENFPRYDVRCKDDIMQEHKITKGKTYQVLGKLFGFLIIKNDAGNLDKLSESRFEELK